MKSLFIVAGLLSIVSYTHAQWNTSNPPHVYYTSGKVGVGTTNPSQMLDVVGRLKFRSNGSASSGVWFTGNDGAETAFLGQVGNSSNDPLGIWHGGAWRFTVLQNGNVGIDATSPQNKLQIGPNPQGWNGNDLVISNTINGTANSTQVLISNALDHSMMYGSADIAIRPGFGKWSIYAKGSNAYVGIGHSTPTAMLHVLQSSNTDWASMVLNTGGSGKGLLVKSGSGNGEVAPIIQLEDNLGANRFMVRSDGRVGIGTNTPQTLFNINQGPGNSTTGTPALRIGGTSNYPSLEFGIKGAYDGMISTYGNDLHIYAGNWRSDGVNATENHNISFYTSQSGSNNWNTAKMYLRYDGNLGIGTTNPTQKLTVKGTVYSTEVKVDVSAGTGPDYVFDPSYNLPTLAETEAYIKANKHLPEVPSAKEMEANGINLSEMNMLLLKKVEELTLHLIEQSQTIHKLNERISNLESKK